MSRTWFIVKEAISGLMRAKLSAFFSVIMVALSFTLLGSFYVTSTQAQRFLTYLRSKVEIEAFLSDSLSSDQIRDIRRSLLSTSGVKSVEFISKEQAAEIFKEEFGQDVKSVLDFNPLPASFKIAIREKFENSRDMAAISSTIRNVPGIESVKYRKFLLTLIDRRIKLFYGVMSGFGGALTLLSIFLVYNSIRLAISHKKKIIDTMKLVGASRTFVRMPFIIGGTIQGFTGGVLGAAVIYGLMNAAFFVLQENVIVLTVSLWQFYSAMIVAATILGLLSTLFATRRYIKESLS